MGSPGARKKHSREELIKLIKDKLYLYEKSGTYRVCRDGLEDALAELEKPVLPDVLPSDMICRIQAKFYQPRVHRTDITYFFELLRAELTAPPKPRMKTIWRVTWNGHTRDFTTYDAAIAEVAAQACEFNVLIDKMEVPA